MINTPIMKKIAEKYDVVSVKNFINEITKVQSIIDEMEQATIKYTKAEKKFEDESREYNNIIDSIRKKCPHLAITKVYGSQYSDNYDECDICGKEL